MRAPTRHLTRCLLAGIVALLPLGGVALTFMALEGALSEGWLREQPFYFPGLGLILAVVLVYLVGLTVTSLLGRWLWRRFDRAMERLPLAGTLYSSIKEVLGYDSARERFFQGVVFVRGETGDELGLITGRTVVGGEERVLVFLPGSPNPANGKLVLLAPDAVQRAEVRVADALRSLVAMGKAPLAPQPES